MCSMHNIESTVCVATVCMLGHGRELCLRCCPGPGTSTSTSKDKTIQRTTMHSLAITITIRSNRNHPEDVN